MSDDEQRTTALLELLAGDLTVCILRQTRESARAAKEIAEQCDSSLKTVYRRLERLEEADLVEAKTVIDEQGNHYTTYSSDLASVHVKLDVATGEVAVDRLSDDEVENFVALWEGLKGQ